MVKEESYKKAIDRVNSSIARLESDAERYKGGEKLFTVSQMLKAHIKGLREAKTKFWTEHENETIFDND